jgi:hypothetical protein
MRTGGHRRKRSRRGGCIRGIDPIVAVLRCVLVLAFCLGALDPSLRSNQASALPSEFVKFATAIGEPPDALRKSICQHDSDREQSPLQDEDGSRLCKKHCLVCQRLAESIAALQSGATGACQAGRTSAAAVIPDKIVCSSYAAPKSSARPRAPPLHA